MTGIQNTYQTMSLMWLKLLKIKMQSYAQILQTTRKLLGLQSLQKIVSCKFTIGVSWHDILAQTFTS